MTIAMLKDDLPDYAKDIKLNLDLLTTAESTPDLSPRQVALVAIAAAYVLKNPKLIDTLETHFIALLSLADKEAMQVAATLMAMNNIYYRFIHEVDDPTFNTLPAKLRMNGMKNSGVNHLEFELGSLVASVLNGCGLCMASHTRSLIKAGVTPLGIQSAIRLTAVLNATVFALPRS
ncbi:MAG: carboxymuconolactone decarboxylase family protein [Gammaproteobacteria bacterium]|nr:carboxymuconolactone decarboxylase family protein [Gammaproteobacteria bacterium]